MVLVVQALVRKGRALTIAQEGAPTTREDALAEAVVVGVAEAAHGPNVLGPIHRPLRVPLARQVLREEGGRGGPGEPAPLIHAAEIAGLVQHAGIEAVRRPAAPALVHRRGREAVQALAGGRPAGPVAFPYLAASLRPEDPERHVVAGGPIGVAARAVGAPLGPGARAPVVPLPEVAGADQAGVLE